MDYTVDSLIAEMMDRLSGLDFVRLPQDKTVKGGKSVISSIEWDIRQAMSNPDTAKLLASYLVWNALGMTGSIAHTYDRGSIVEASRGFKTIIGNKYSVSQILKYGDFDNLASYLINRPDATELNRLVGLSAGELISLRRDSYEREFEHYWGEATKGLGYIPLDIVKNDARARYMGYMEAKLSGGILKQSQLRADAPPSEDWIFQRIDTMYAGGSKTLTTAWNATVTPLMPAFVPQYAEEIRDAVERYLMWADKEGVILTDNDVATFKELVLANLKGEEADSALVKQLSADKAHVWEQAQANTKPAPPIADTPTWLAKLEPIVKEVYGRSMEELPEDIYKMLQDVAMEHTKRPSDFYEKLTNSSMWTSEVRSIQQYFTNGLYYDQQELDDTWDEIFNTVKPYLSPESWMKLQQDKGKYVQGYLSSISSKSPSQIAYEGGFRDYLAGEVLSPILTGVSDLYPLASKSQAAEDRKRALVQLSVASRPKLVQELVKMGLDPEVAMGAAAGMAPLLDENGLPTEDRAVWAGRVLEILGNLKGAITTDLSAEDLFTQFENKGYISDPSVYNAKKYAEKVKEDATLEEARLLARSSGNAGFAALVDAGIDPDTAAGMELAFNPLPGETATEYESRLRDFSKKLASIQSGKHPDRPGSADAIFATIRNTPGVFNTEADWNIRMGKGNAFLGQPDRKQPTLEPEGLTAGEARSTYAQFIEEWVRNVPPGQRNAIRSQLLRGFDDVVRAWQEEQKKPPVLPEDAMKAYEAEQQAIRDAADLQNTFLKATLQAEGLTPEDWANIVRGATQGMQLGPTAGGQPTGVTDTEPGGAGQTPNTPGYVPPGGQTPSELEKPANQPAGTANLFPRTTANVYDPKQAQEIYKRVMGRMSQGYGAQQGAQKKKKEQTSFGDFLRTNAPDLSGVGGGQARRAPVVYVR